MQVPRLPASAHERHVPVQLEVQQTPCSQNVELHSAGAAQVAPIGFLPQLPVMQVLGALQSPLPPQVVRQVPVQLELQQTFCWQRPDAHSTPPVQAWPSGFLVHWPALQMLGEVHSMSVEQVVRQVALGLQV